MPPYQHIALPAGGQKITVNADPATKEALRYRTALHQGFESLKARPLCTGIAVDVCRTLKGVSMDVRRTPGTPLANERTGEVVYTPREGETHSPTAMAARAASSTSSTSSRKSC